MADQIAAPASNLPQLPKTYGNGLMINTTNRVVRRLIKGVILILYIGLMLSSVFGTYNHGIKTSNMVAGLIWGLIFWTPPFVILWRYLDSRIEVTQQGITKYRIRKKQFFAWQEIIGIEWRTGKFLWLKLTDGPVHACLILKDGSTASINMVMHATWIYIGGRPSTTVLPTDPLNMATMNEFNMLLKAHNPQATSKMITTDDAYALQKKDATLMMAGQVTPEQVEDIANQFHSSKIVKFGGGLLALFWIFAISSWLASAIGAPGIILALGFFLAISIAYRWYRRTKSPLAWYFLSTLILVLICTMSVLTYYRHR